MKIPLALGLLSVFSVAKVPLAFGAVGAATIGESALSGPAWTVEGQQTGAFLGASVAPAGDVNGDGFSDVIVGAPSYDNGQVNEGRAFLYLGSAAGLSVDAAWTVESDQAQAEFGSSVATAGDVNGDGFSDVIVGAWRYDNGQTDEGAAFVYLGSSAGLSTTAAWSAESGQAVARFGSSVSTAGDVNGDGFSDVIVGAYTYENGETDEGGAFVYLGSSTGLATVAAWTAEGDQPDATFGDSVACAGDVNGDGFDDVIVGAPNYDGLAGGGRAYVYTGSGGGLSQAPAWTVGGAIGFAALFGASVSTAGDVNGDGYADVIVGAPGHRSGGAAFVYLGSNAGLAARADWIVEGDQIDEAFGVSVACAGDVNGDGYSDVLVGAPMFDGPPNVVGRARLFLGAATGLDTNSAWTVQGVYQGARLGSSVAAAGDVNGDGYGDVIIGAPTEYIGFPDEGRALVYFGASEATAAAASWASGGDQTAAAFGYSVASAGDVNGDGHSDVIVGAPLFDNGQVDEGGAFLYLGSTAGTSASAAWMAEGDQTDARFGGSVAAAGDVNGDGYGDVIVGAFRYDGDQTDEGRVFVYLGSSAGLSPTPAWTVESDQASAWLGFSVAGAGDVDGDGFGDVIIASPLYDDVDPNEGRAFVYLGSLAGLATTPAWTAGGDQAGAQFGNSVNTAGDVDADGYSDVIVGAFEFDNGQSNEGRAFVYAGSSSGLSSSAAWTAESHQVNARFGSAAAGAGDVNGDGFSDVIVGAFGFDGGAQDEGRAYVYLGSSAGLSTSFDWTAESDQADARLGHAVATAGDVNADGFSDVIVGAHLYDNGLDDMGHALVYLGSSSGLSPSASWAGDLDLSFDFQAFASYGFAVAAAGDVNGDGYADIVVGSVAHDAGETDEGKAYVYLGNGAHGSGLLAPQQLEVNDAAPIAALGRSHDRNRFRIRLSFECDLAGVEWTTGVAPTARLEWEVRRLGLPLDGTCIEAGALQPITGSLLSFSQVVEAPSSANAPLTIGAAHFSAGRAEPYHWRVRVRTNNPLRPVTPWVTLAGSNVTETKLRVGPLQRKR
jgi:hypothetical protein